MESSLNSRQAYFMFLTDYLKEIGFDIIIKKTYTYRFEVKERSVHNSYIGGGWFYRTEHGAIEDAVLHTINYMKYHIVSPRIIKYKQIINTRIK